ncbi:MAG TPA: metalloregulator ArsR/SmtB family transcription factor [Rhizomicrobium sp.]|jgi:DNA-binding transcriptional ArsR family regulator|nr:metalloregulator ArsR/SmtB family transcription factor [Rhizomicrobium sp.]
MQARADAVFKSLADPTRRVIFERLCRKGEQTVWELTEDAGVSQPAVSKHLGQLKSAGLVRARPQGRETHYSAEPKALRPLVDWLGFYAAFWREKFDALEDLLRRIDQ